MGALQAASCGLIAAGLALAPARPRHVLARVAIAAPLGFALSVAVTAVAS